jgi:signal transduction histidine kinase/DNA-binding NarL/FixJ family response regulator/HPt (histidine-containing phosphotransfer) domain-containing protein
MKSSPPAYTGLQRGRLLFLLPALALAAFIVCLISFVYISQRQTLEARQLRIMAQAERQASAISHLIGEIKLDAALLFRQQDFIDFSDSTPKSVQPGQTHPAGREAVRRLLTDFIASKALSGERLYNRIVLFSSTGRMLMDTSANKEPVHLPAGIARALASDVDYPLVFSLTPEIKELTFAVPLVTDSTRAGYAVVFCNTRAVTSFLESLWDLNDAYILLLQGQSGIALHRAEQISPEWIRQASRLEPGLLYTLSSEGEPEMLQHGAATSRETGIRHHVDNSPFDLLLVFSGPSIGGAVSPNVTLVAVALLAAIIAVSFYHVFRSTMRAREHKARAEAAAASEKRILQQNALLNAEIEERIKAEHALREAKELAEEADKAKGEFLANISHEFRTPMNAIIGMSEVILKTELSAPQRNHLTVLNKAAHSLLDLLNTILDFSRYESGKATLALSPFMLHAPFTQVHEMFLSAAAAKGLPLQLELAPDMPRAVEGDEGKIRQILVNLVSNALKFTDTGNITITCKAFPAPSGRADICFSVSDTGIGIEKEKHSAIFDSFTQADGSYTRTYGGTGLGLSICKLLADMMGGSITVRSAPRQGSTFTVCLPLKAVPEERVFPAAENPAVRPSKAASPLSVLVAEDNEFNREVIREILGLSGHSSTLVQNGEQALQALSTQDFDVVLLDIQMPVMDGVQTAQKIRSGACGNRNAGIPIIALTAHSMEGDKKRFLQAGMTEYLAKPVTPDHLNHVLGKYAPLPAAAPAGQFSAAHGFQPAAGKATTAQADPDIPPPDLSLALSMLNGKQKVLTVMLGTFVRTMPDRIAALHDALQKKDIQALAEQGHALKSTLHSIGSLPGRSVAEQLENAGRSGNTEAAVTLAPRLIHVLEFMTEHLRRQIDSSQSHHQPSSGGR